MNYFALAGLAGIALVWFALLAAVTNNSRRDRRVEGQRRRWSRVYDHILSRNG